MDIQIICISIKYRISHVSYLEAAINSMTLSGLTMQNVFGADPPMTLTFSHKDRLKELIGSWRNMSVSES